MFSEAGTVAVDYEWVLSVLVGTGYQLSALPYIVPVFTRIDRDLVFLREVRICPPSFFFFFFSIVPLEEYSSRDTFCFAVTVYSVLVRVCRITRVTK